MMPISETIRRRYSCRSYADRPVDPNVLRRFEQEMTGPQTGPFGHGPRFVLIPMDHMPREEWKKLGTYGFIQNARLYLAGILKPAPKATCDYGYCKERLILKATELDLNTCWLGGTFSISAFGRAAGLQKDEVLPTISPIGLAAGQRSLRERLIRGFAGSDHRKPWKDLFFEGNFTSPLSPEAAGDYCEALENVRLAPSASNKQPWRIVYAYNRKTFDFYLSRAPGYRYLRDISLQEIDMGIAMCHFQLTNRELGLAGVWRMDNSAPQTTSWEYVASWQIGF